MTMTIDRNTDYEVTLDQRKALLALYKEYTEAVETSFYTLIETPTTVRFEFDFLYDSDYRMKCQQYSTYRKVEFKFLKACAEVLRLEPKPQAVSKRFMETLFQEFGHRPFSAHEAIGIYEATHPNAEWWDALVTNVQRNLRWAARTGILTRELAGRKHADFYLYRFPEA